MGDYQIVGGYAYTDDGELVGQIAPMRVISPQQMRGAGGGNQLAPNALRFNPALLRGAAAQLTGRPTPALRETAPTRIDETLLPITATAVAAAAAVAIPVTAQIIFRPQRLIIPSSIAPFFTVDDLRVGNVPLFAGSGSIPAETFAPESVNPNLRKVTANPGIAVTITVTNLDLVAHTFRASIGGEGAQPDGC